MRLEIQKTLAFLHDKILALTDEEKAPYNRTLAGLRNREKELIEAQENTPQTTLKEDFQELADVLADIPGRLDGCTMARKQKLARLITERVVIEEVSVHWLRLTIFWRGPLAARPDVCFIWCQRGRRHVERWTDEEDEYIAANYATGDKWTILEHFPDKTWNMIRDRSRFLGVHRRISQVVSISDNVTMSDLQVMPDRAVALQILEEVSQRSSKTVKRDSQSFAVWLYPAGLSEFVKALEHRTGDSDDPNGENGRGNRNEDESAIPPVEIAVSTADGERRNGNHDERACRRCSSSSAASILSNICYARSSTACYWRR